MRRIGLLALIGFLMGCGAAAGALERATAVLRTDARTVLVRVEVADESAELLKGLMDRRSLPANAGMVFVFPADTRGGFWMKDTLIPLSIAFVDRRGKIVRILDMVPCRREPCRIYDPGVTYRTALEVNRGAFQRWGVTAGDTMRVRR